MNKNFLLTLAFAFAAPAFANSNIEIQGASVSGDGCPIGTATVILTNSFPSGPVDFVQVTFDNLRVENTGAGVARLFKKSCRLALDVKLPAGYTLGTIDFQNEGYRDRGEKDTKMILETNLHARAVNSAQPIRRYPFALMSRNSIEGDFRYIFPIYDIGDTSADSCDTDRVVTIEVDWHLYLKTSRRSKANAMANVKTASLTISRADGTNSVPCQDASDVPWWWGW